MEAKDTVMTPEAIKQIPIKPRYFGGIQAERGRDRDKAIAQAQAEISFKAGTREVAEFANHFPGIKHNPEWIAQLKKWGG